MNMLTPRPCDVSVGTDHPKTSCERENWDKSRERGFFVGAFKKTLFSDPTLLQQLKNHHLHLNLRLCVSVCVRLWQTVTDSGI